MLSASVGVWKITDDHFQQFNLLQKVHKWRTAQTGYYWNVSFIFLFCSQCSCAWCTWSNNITLKRSTGSCSCSALPPLFMFSFLTSANHFLGEKKIWCLAHGYLPSVLGLLASLSQWQFGWGYFSYIIFNVHISTLVDVQTHSLFRWAVRPFYSTPSSKTSFLPQSVARPPEQRIFCSSQSAVIRDHAGKALFIVSIPDLLLLSFCLSWNLDKYGTCSQIGHTQEVLRQEELLFLPSSTIFLQQSCKWPFRQFHGFTC